MTTEIKIGDTNLLAPSKKDLKEVKKTREEMRKRSSKSMCDEITSGLVGTVKGLMKMATKMGGEKPPKLRLNKREVANACVNGVESFLTKLGKIPLGCEPEVTIPMNDIMNALDSCDITPMDKSMSSKTSAMISSFGCLSTSTVEVLTEPRLDSCFNNIDTTIEFGSEMIPLMEMLADVFGEF